jgi:hypothetical protein
MIGHAVVFLLLMAALLGSPAGTAGLTGKHLKEYCSDHSGIDPEGLACSFYLQGFVAGIQAGDGSKSRDEKIWCFPESFALSEARRVVERFMEDNPVLVQMDADRIVATALMQAHPCFSQSGRK